MSSMPATPTPVSSAQRKRARRTLLACENCRRKKTRCPGERPRCSTCSRLGQACRYPEAVHLGEETPGQHEHQREQSYITVDNTGQTSYIRRLEDRLARLEAKLDGKQDKVETAQSASPPSNDIIGDPSSRGIIVAAPTINNTPLPHLARSSDLPPTYIIQEAIRIYFRCSHRQPVWLFEPRSALSVSSPDVILLCVLALSTQHSPDAFASFTTEHTLKSPTEYNAAASSAILQQIAKSAVDFSTLQALCLLSFSNLVCGDLQLASFHVALVNNLMQCAGLDTHVSADRTPVLEGQRRLFWSVQMVAVLCGAPLKIASTYDIKSPHFLLPQETNLTCRRQQGASSTSEDPAAPLLPLDPTSMSIRRSNIERDPQQPPRAVMSIWLHMVRSASLWGLVRSYVWRCHVRNTPHAPWHPDADYTAIYAQLLDMEGAFPLTFRYDAARFIDQPLDELKRQGDFWLPWMKIQVTYHTIHSVLNHPFLYSPRVSQPRPGGPNAFWKTSTDLALLHSTWIARILGMAYKKGLALADPFFVYAAAVAITLHLYWSRAADPSIRAAAEKYIEVCRTFISELAAHWPVCRKMEHDVELLMKLSASSRPKPQEGADTTSAEQQASPSTTPADNISLIWRILDFAAFQQPNAPLGQSMFHSSLRESLLPRAASPEQMDLEDPQVESPPKDFQTSLGDYAAPPDWFSPPDDPPTDNAGNTAPTRQQEGQDTARMPPMLIPPTTSQVDVQVSQTMDDLSSWTAWETTQPSEAASAMIFDPFGQLFISRNAPDYSRWWDGGHL